ncbi:hypothetical protein [Butyrivibrio sp. INlla21]|uniref:hypothetical protein n=1 Tax=Butyrivibrio sp. INlla21 TaxID=1520811 RepID=UPI0008E711F3|nr:hypothetical protein [Butyrivibrio sp. INlla21]SFV01840.1 hypothetical protein SAMN02910342_02995 [Butyrivibrio sp. INlla21]
MNKEMYAISYYGERYRRGYVEMEFLDRNYFDNHINGSRRDFWEKMTIITADVPYYIFKEFFEIKRKTFTDNGVLFKVIVEEKESNRGRRNRGFACTIYEEGMLNSRDSRISILHAERCALEEERYNIELLTDKISVSEYPRIEGNTLPFDINWGDEIPGESEWEESPRRGRVPYVFKVHNVGQGLATSLQKRDCIPSLYFDYGTNKGAVHPGLFLEVDEEKTIIALSHVHEDHWNAFRTNIRALRCTWLVPDQTGKCLYSSFLAAILILGGRFYIYGTNIDLHKAYIGHAGSTIDPTRAPNLKSNHQDGYAMYIEGSTEEKEFYKIVVSGDQDYDYQDPVRYENPDTLVACHHGGEYCWSKKFAGIAPADDYSIVVYSYGAGNTYGHPSKTADYVGWGWNNEHRTEVNGTYSIDIWL